MDEEFEIIENKSELVKSSDINWGFIDISFINNESKFKLLNDSLSMIKINIVDSHAKSLKASVLYVIYKLIYYNIIQTNDDLNNEFNK